MTQSLEITIGGTPIEVALYDANTSEAQSRAVIATAAAVTA